MKGRPSISQKKKSIQVKKTRIREQESERENELLLAELAFIKISAL